MIVLVELELALGTYRARLTELRLRYYILLYEDDATAR